MVADGDEGRAVAHPPLIEAAADQPKGERRRVHGKRQPLQRPGQRPDVILMAVGADAAHDPIGPVAQVLQIGEHEVGAGHVLVGEQHPAVQQEQLAPALDGRAIPPDIAQPTEKGDLNRFSHQHRAACRPALGPRPRSGRRARRPAADGNGRPASRSGASWPWPESGWAPPTPSRSHKTALGRR